MEAIARMDGMPPRIRIGTPSLDQLQVLTAVAEAGSFSEAGRRLGRAQSVISYTIAQLETQLGLTLFDRAARRPALTEAGRAMLGDARRIAAVLEELRARAAGLQGGLEGEVSLAVDVMFPTCRLVRALEAFSRAYPTVSLRLRVEALGAVVELVRDRTCVLAIAGWMAMLFEGLDRHPLGESVLIPVAAPGHALAALPAPIPIEALREHTQLVLADRSRLTEGNDFGVLSPRTWRLGDLGAKHALLLAGLGFGNMPKHLIDADLADGRLVRLPITGNEERAFPLLLTQRSDTALGPAGRWLAERLQHDDAREDEPDRLPQPHRALRI